MFDDHLILAGGGHTHALLLLSWIRQPKLKPRGLITLVTRNTSTLYSGMVPGLIGGIYNINECLIDLFSLAGKAGIAFIKAEIIGIDLKSNLLLLNERPPINFDTLSLDVGSETNIRHVNENLLSNNFTLPIRPLRRAIAWLKQIENDEEKMNQTLTILGSGISAVEIAFALRRRWPNKKIQLKVKSDTLIGKLKDEIIAANIDVIQSIDTFDGLSLLCTGSSAPKWLELSNLPVNDLGRVLTLPTLQVLNYSNIFAVGDCGVILNNFRPASGVWAVRAEKILCKNLYLYSHSKKLISWTPQYRALQLIGGINKYNKSFAWVFWAGFVIGPYPIFWNLKKFLDKRFIQMFQSSFYMNSSRTLETQNMACRGCAAKLPQKYLKDALLKAGLKDLATQPEDSACIDSKLFDNKSYLQSVDGFPALVSDPWLNGRLTALHACSDLWVSGASVISAQTIISLPQTNSSIQKYLLTQSILGIESVLKPQGAKLIGGHTFEARDSNPLQPSLGVAISLSVNGHIPSGINNFSISGMQKGDVLLLSRGIGSGVIFAAASQGEKIPRELDKLLVVLSQSQHQLLDDLISLEEASSGLNPIHASTDITGFGLLGHIYQMLNATNSMRNALNKSSLQVELYAMKIPALFGAYELLEKGFKSTLSPFNSDFLQYLDNHNNDSPLIQISMCNESESSRKYKTILDLIIDPQTCGPLLISCSESILSKLTLKGPWKEIGRVI